MHLSCAPQQCLQARSKHILHVTLQLQLQLAYFTLGVWAELKIYCLVSLIFFSSHHQVFGVVSVKSRHLTGCFSTLSLSLLLLVCVEL